MEHIPIQQALKFIQYETKDKIYEEQLCYLMSRELSEQRDDCYEFNETIARAPMEQPFIGFLPLLL